MEGSMPTTTLSQRQITNKIYYLKKSGQKNKYKRYMKQYRDYHSSDEDEEEKEKEIKKEEKEKPQTEEKYEIEEEEWNFNSLYDGNKKAITNLYSLRRVLSSEEQTILYNFIYNNLLIKESKLKTWLYDIL